MCMRSLVRKTESRHTGRGVPLWGPEGLLAVPETEHCLEHHGVQCELESNGYLRWLL